MSSVVELSYVFTPASSASTILFSEEFNLHKLKAITNQTRNALIYVPGLTGFGGSFDGDGRTLTLEYNTASHDASDILLFQYDDEVKLDQVVASLDELTSSMNSLLVRLIAEVRANSMVLMAGPGGLDLQEVVESVEADI